MGLGTPGLRPLQWQATLQGTQRKCRSIKGLSCSVHLGNPDITEILEEEEEIMGNNNGLGSEGNKKHIDLSKELEIGSTGFESRAVTKFSHENLRALLPRLYLNVRLGSDL